MSQAIIFSGDDNQIAANVKPASTPATATDPALVVAISPNNPVTTSAPTPVATAAGTTDSRVKSAATINATTLKATAGNLYGFILSNRSSKGRYIKFYDKASAPNPATDTPKFTVFLEPAVMQPPFEPTFPIFFTSGISYTITTNVADTDNTAVAVDDVHGLITWF